MNGALTPRHEVEALARRGDEIYDRNILPKLRPEDKGKIVAIDAETGDYELATDELTAAHGLRARRPASWSQIAQRLGVLRRIPAFDRTSLSPPSLGEEAVPVR